MKYTDPSGEHPVVVAMIIAAAVSATMYTVNCVINNQAITLQGFMGSAITGAVSGAFTFGIGTATSTIANFYVRAAVQAVAHGTFQGGMSEAQGGTFAQGFYSGSLSSLAASAFSGGQHLGSDGTPLECTGWGGAGKFAKNDFGMIAFGTVSGGLGAELAGGNFWQGAATGLIVSFANHYLTHVPKPKVTLEFDGEYMRIYEGDEIVLSLRAVSGRADENGVFDYSVENQKVKNSGPIPEGSYTINPQKIQRWTNQDFTTRTAAFFKRGTWPGGIVSWGEARTWITPSGAETYGRSGFTIHGGTSSGSAGCIDLTKNNGLFFKTLQKYSNYKSIPLTVKYR